MVSSWFRGAAVALAFVGQAMAAPCSERAYGVERLTPETPGPARLDAFRKTTFVRADLDQRHGAQVSPDGAAYFMVRRRVGLQFGPEPGGSTPEVARLPELVDVGHPGAAIMPYAWQADSRAVFGASQARMHPRGGWALEGWRPLRIWRDGRIERLPQLSHPSGELDSLQWAGGRGLALAQFGARGGLYRPQRENRAPAFAFVDAVRGRVLATFPFDTIPGVEPRRDGSDYALFPQPAAVIVRPDGKLRAVIQVARGPWVILDQDRPPRLAAIPAKPFWSAGVALSGDGRRVLVTPTLQASGVICERDPHCPRPTPVEGPYAALYELETGKQLWQLRATATDFWTYPLPALNADGSLALVGLPGDVSDFWPRVALVSSHTGGVVQTLCAADANTNVLRFLHDGRFALSGVGHFAVYKLMRRGR